MADPQILWHDYNLRILRFQEMVAPEQWLRLNGEDFLTDMDGHLLRLCDWLGISRAPEAIAAMKRPEDSPFACFGPVNALVGNDPNFLRAPSCGRTSATRRVSAGPLSWRPDGGSFHPRVGGAGAELWIRLMRIAADFSPPRRRALLCPLAARAAEDAPHRRPSRTGTKLAAAGDQTAPAHLCTLYFDAGGRGRWTRPPP